MADETPLALGQVYGLRVWSVSQIGLLHPIAKHQASNWHNGENEASCTELAKRAPTRPVEPVAPRHPDTVSGHELLHSQDVDYGVAHRAGRRLQVREPGAHDQRRMMPALVTGDSVEVDQDRRRIWSDVRERSLRDYERDMNDHQQRVRRYEGQLELFLRAYEEYEQEVQEHLAPVQECTCGFWMVKERQKVPNLTGVPSIIGVVKGYGRIIPYEDGWRFSKGVIVALSWYGKVYKPDYAYMMGTTDHRVQRKLDIGKNEELQGKVRNNYPDATWFETEDEMLTEWELVVGAS